MWREMVRRERAEMVLEEQRVGSIWDVDVIAAWCEFPDGGHRYRYAVILEGKSFPLWFHEGRVFLVWDRARTEGEAREKALEMAESLLRALPREWVRIEDEDPPF
jgi:hypothetical protein